MEYLQYYAKILVKNKIEYDYAVLNLVINGIPSILNLLPDSTSTDAAMF